MNIAGFIAGLFIAIVVTERITEIIVDSEIFNPLRNIVKRWAYPIDEPPKETLLQQFKIKIDYLINCGYCASVWVGHIVALLLLNNSEILVLFCNSKLLNFFMYGFFIHGMSNVIHNIFKLIQRGRVITFDVLHNVNITNTNQNKEAGVNDI